MIGVGFTGTRFGMTEAQKEKVALILETPDEPVKAHHGDCIGADSDFHDICSGHYNVKIIVAHPPSNPSKRAWKKANFVRREKPYLDRNRDIVDEAEIVIATPQGYDEGARSGTWSTIRYARRKRIRLFIVYPNGAVIMEGRLDAVMTDISLEDL